MVKHERNNGLSRLASRQHGAFSRAQALGAGFTPTEIRVRVSNGVWIRLGRGVYAMGGSVASWERRGWVRVLEAGAGAAISHRAAGYAHELIDDPPERIDVTVPHEHVRRDTHRARSFTRADVKLQNGLPITCVARTIVDLAGVVARERLEDVIDRALLRGLTSIPSLRAYIRSRGLAHVRGVGKLQRLLDDREGGVPESELERAFERLLRRFGLPMPDRQVSVGRHRVDFVYTQQRVWIELNGRRDHGKKAAFDGDHVRHNDVALELVDHIPLRFTWTQVAKRPSYVAAKVEAALNVRG